jgi:hypothetical protein
MTTLIKVSITSILFELYSIVSCSHAMAAHCNGGATVTSSLTISSNCDGGGSSPLTLGTGAAVTINQGVTVSNTASSGRNGDPVSVLSSATASSITNYGTISTAAQYGVTNNGIVTNLTNFGTISSGSRRGVVNQASGTIITLTNSGSITGPFADVTNSNAIGTINNLQGMGNNSGALTIATNLPTNYNIIIRSPSLYGQLDGSSASPGAMTFNIY